MAFRPITQEYLQNDIAEYAQTPQAAPEKSWVERAKDDIVNTVENYITGAKQGYQEAVRANTYNNNVNPYTSEEYLGLSEAQPETKEQQEAKQWASNANKTFLNETVKPVAYAAGLVAPIVAAPFIAQDAANSFEKGGIGQVARDFTYGGAVDFANQPDLAQKFHDRPISTTAEGAMSILPAAITGRVLYKGVRNGVTSAKDLVNSVEEKLNTSLDENLPSYPVRAVNGLDALDQIDSPTRGFRPATPDEMRQWNIDQRQQAGQNLINTLNNVAGQKFDNATAQGQRFTPNTLINELPKTEAGQQISPLLKALEERKRQKFDEANQESYWQFLDRQAKEADTLQERKNTIANETLLNPVDRLEIGADLPQKTRLPGQGLVFGEQKQPSSLILPKAENPIQQKPAEAWKLKDANDLINNAQKRMLNEQLKDAVNIKDYVKAEQLADKMSNEGVETQLSQAVKAQKGNVNKLYSGFDPTGGKFDDLTVRDVVNKLKPEKKDRIIDNNDSKPNISIKDMLDKAYQRTLDSLHPIKKYSKSAYINARMASGKAIGRAEEMLKRPDINNSFESIVSPVKNRLDDFAEYVAAVRAQELHSNGIGTGISNERIAKIISEAPLEFKTAQSKLTAYSDRLLDVLVDGGIISKESVAAMRGKYQNYAPMMRAFEASDIDKIFSKKGFDIRNPIQKIKGSNDKIINPLESVIKNTFTFHLLAEQNKVRQGIAKLADRYPDEIKPVEGSIPNAKEGIFTVYINGKKQAFQADPRLYEALASMDSTTSNIVVKVLSKPASWLRAGATLSPEFMARNLIRDTINAAIVGKNFTPIVDTVRGLKSALKKDETYWEYKREGGSMGHLTGIDRDHLQEALNNYREKSKAQKFATPFNPKIWLNVLRRAQELSEDATRIGYYKKRLSKGDTQEMAAYEARDLIDFGRSGDYTREWNKISAFLNASVQGTDKLVRSMRERPLETSANIIKYLVLPSIAVWYMGKDNQRIQQLPDWQKDLFWVIPAGNTLIRIPKPFEPGVLFASGTERTLNQNFKGYGKSVYDVLAPNFLPTSLVPLAEVWANKSFFTGQDIVPKREQNLPERLQYGTFTSGLAKQVGNTFNVSPRKVDSLIRGYTGGTGTNLLNIYDTIKEYTVGTSGPKKPALTASEFPIIRGFVSDPRKGSQSVQSFYDKLNDYQQKEAGTKVEHNKLRGTDKQNYKTLSNANNVMKELNKQEREILSSSKMSPEQKRKQLDAIADKQNKLAQAALNRLKK